VSGLFGSKKKVSTSSPIISSLRVTTALAGKPIPLLYGKTRVSPNVIEYTDFTATANKSSSQSGGKGGGSSNNDSTSYSYSAAIEFAICQGPMNAVTQVWKDKNVYTGNLLATTISATQGGIVNYNGGATAITVVNAATYVTDQGITVSGAGPGVHGGEGNLDNQWLSYLLVPGTDYTVSAGTYTLNAAFCALWAGCVLQISYTYTVPSYTPDALAFANLAPIHGQIGQAAWSYMVGAHPAVALGYSGICLAVASSYALDSSGSVPNCSFEVDTPWGFNAAVRDANPRDILYDLLTNPYYGAYYPASRVGDLSNWSNYCIASYFFLSPCWTDQKSMQDILTQLMALTNSDCFFSERVLKVVPYADQTVQGTYGTWTPNLTAVYSLTDDSYLPFGGSSSSGSISGDGDGSDGPVQMARKSPTEQYNSMYLKFYDRALSYNENSIPCTDKAAIDQYGVQPAPDFEAYEICDGTVARQVGQAILQRMVYVNNVYQFTLPFSYCLLEPMDLLAITDSLMGLSAQLVRITDIEEDDQLNLSITAEEVPVGHATSIQYASKSSTGFSTNYNVVPLSVAAPVFFEPPVSLAGNTGLAVCVAVNGQAGDPNWGGCDVWVSSDGTTYAKLATVHTGTRYGTLGAAMAAGATDAIFNGVGLTQTILPGTTTDAANKSTLLWIASATGGGEFCSYVGATLTGTYQYDLGGLVHGQYDSASQAHLLGANIVRFDDLVVQSAALDISQIGSALYFKFTSFNQYGGGEQSLGSVTAYSYVITGAQTLLPPSNVASVSAVAENFVERISWPLVPDLDIAYYRLRVGSSSTPWASGTPLVGTNAQGTHISGDSFPWGPQLAGTYKVMVKAVSSFGVESATEASCVVVVAVPAPSGAVGSFNGANYVLQWVSAEGNFQIAGFNVYTGATFGTATRIASNLQSSIYTAPAKWDGTQKFYVTSLDAAGNESTPSEIDLVIVAPSAPTVFTANSIDNTVQFYWALPASGTLPVASYQIYQGPVFSGAALLGAVSGNATFDTFFESAAGAYTFWIQATDTAGNVSTAQASISINVAAPPNFSLQADVHSQFDGALVNMLVQGGPTPTGWDVLNTGSAIAITTVGPSNTLTAIAAPGNGMARTLTSKETGKWYWETHMVTAASGAKVGISQSNSPLTALSADGTSFSYNQAGTITNGSTSLQTGLATFAAGDILGMAMDLGVHTLQFYKNGTAIGTAVTIGGSIPWYPTVSLANSGDKADSYFGERPFSETAPAGFFAVTQGGVIFGPVNTTETMPGHGTNNSWTNPAAQIGAGYPIYSAPNSGTGSYEEVFDYGANVASTLISMTWTIDAVHSLGSVTITPKISVSATSDTGPWTDYAGVSSVFATNFRWVKFHLDFAATSPGQNFVQLSGIEYKLSLKLKNDSGTGNAVSTDAAPGTTINLNVPFIALTSVTITPTGTTPCTWAVNGLSVGNPTQFEVLFWNQSGARISQAFTWQASGV
jgi:hypothetical protein